MADGWQTKIVPFIGGLITNESPYQQGFRNPGSARILINYEPSVKGGYRRINGYNKAVTTVVPYHGEVYVQGTSSSGTTLYVANMFYAPSADDTLTIDGITGEYTVSSVTHSSSDYTATITLTTSLDSSPANKAAVTFTSGSTEVEGISTFDGDVVVARGGNLYKNAGTLSFASSSTAGWTMINKPTLGTVLVDGASQTGTTLRVDGLTKTPVSGITLQVDGIDDTYTIQSVSEVSSGTYDLTISPSLASSPADDAAVTVVGYNISNNDGSRQHYDLHSEKFQLGSTRYLLTANGNEYPFLIDQNYVFTVLADIPVDAKYAESVAYFNTSAFFGKDDIVTFSSPYSPFLPLATEDYQPANGAGDISVGTEIVNLIVFRDQLIVFGKNSIKRITPSGDPNYPYNLSPITTDLGCIKADSIQEVGSDIMFLAPDGLRLLGATDRIGDFNLDPVASKIQNVVSNLVDTVPNTRVASVVVRGKSQYRLFATGSSIIDGKGLLGANIVNPDTGSPSWTWAELKNYEVTYADSEIYKSDERIVFTNDTGFVFFMENANSFDGESIQATYATPFIPFDDPELRKTLYKLFVYVDPEASVDITSSLKFDFNDPDVVLPAATTISLSNTATAPSQYGSLTAEYGVARYGGSLRAVFKTQLVGSAFSVSFFFQSNDTNPPYTLDTMTVEYALRGRR